MGQCAPSQPRTPRLLCPHRRGKAETIGKLLNAQDALTPLHCGKCYSIAQIRGPATN